VPEIESWLAVDKLVTIKKCHFLLDHSVVQKLLNTADLLTIAFMTFSL